MSDFDERWLAPGGVVPVDIPTTGALIREVQRLRAAVPEGREQVIEECAQTVEGLRTHHPHIDNRRQDSAFNRAAQEIRKMLRAPQAQTRSVCPRCGVKEGEVCKDYNYATDQCRYRSSAADESRKDK